MSRTVELIPFVGMILDGKTVRLGDTRADVKRALGRPLGRDGDTASRLSTEEQRILDLLGGPDGPAVVIGGPEAPPEEAPLPEGPRWYYFDSELRVDFDGDGRAEFIELLGGPDGRLQPVIYGMEAFRAQPETVVELLKEKNSGDFLDNERGCSYAFKKLSVGLYREIVPENVAEMIEEARADGHPLSEADIEYEKRRTHWATIGVGVEGYYE